MTVKTVPAPHGVTTRAAGRLQHVCPFADETDDGTVALEWVTNGATFELHSLAAYLQTWTGERLSHEDLTDRIRTDLTDTPGVRLTSVTTAWSTAGLGVTCGTSPTRAGRTCVECGNDDAAEGYESCVECLETYSLSASRMTVDSDSPRPADTPRASRHRSSATRTLRSAVPLDTLRYLRGYCGEVVWGGVVALYPDAALAEYPGFVGGDPGRGAFPTPSDEEPAGLGLLVACESHLFLRLSRWCRYSLRGVPTPVKGGRRAVLRQPLRA